jgi:hypothetical protein
MPGKFSIGLSRKTGRPNYGSLGAGWHVELEMDAKILDNVRSISGCRCEERRPPMVSRSRQNMLNEC